MSPGWLDGGRDDRRSRWLLHVAGGALALAILRGLARYGAAETRVLYAVFLLAVPAALLAWVALPASLLRRPQGLLLTASGALLAFAIFAKPTLEARGLVLAFVGWCALGVALGLAYGGEKQQRAIALAVVLIGVGEAAIGLHQALTGGIGVPGVDGTARELARGTLYNRNHFAGLLHMTLPLAIGVLYAAVARERTARGSETWALTWFVLLSTSLMGAAVLLSHSRAGVLVLICVLTLQAILLAIGRRRRGGVGLPGRAIAILLLLIAAIGAALGLEPLIERFQLLDDDSSRPVLYRDTLALIRDHPLGVGPGMYRWRFRPYQTQMPDRRFDHAHNDYLETAAEWGIAGAAALWTFVAWRMVRTIRVFLSSADAWRRGLGLGVTGSIAALLLHSLVDFNLQIPTTLMLFSTVLALGWSLDLTAIERRGAEECVG